MRIETQTSIKVTVGDAVLNLTRGEAKQLLEQLKGALGETSIPLFPAHPIFPDPEKEKIKRPWEPARPWNPEDWPKLYGTSWPPGTVLCGQ